MKIPYGSKKGKDIRTLPHADLLHYLLNSETLKYPGLYEEVSHRLYVNAFSPTDNTPPPSSKEYKELLQGIKRLVTKAYHPDVYPQDTELWMRYISFLVEIEKAFVKD